MKRPFWPCLFAAVSLTGCQPRADEASDVQAEAQGWLRAPVIETARPVSGGVRIAGTAQPGGRIILRAETGAASATSADRAGRFALIVPTPAVPTLFSLEIQQGQDAARTGARLLLVPGGPRAVIQPGAPTRRLDGDLILTAIDSDGHTALLSGSGAAPAVTAAGAALDTSASSAGWVARTPADALADVRIAGRPTNWPGPAAEPGIEALSNGWRLDFQEEGSGRLIVWLPAPVTRR